jgi:hypothetical protein
MPTATDLVTDLPADFEVFGQAVATSMGDLLGGTSGQILAKNSNTDMDFVWVTNDVGDITAVTAGTGISGGGTSGAVTITNSMATEIAAKGDLIVGTGSATFDNLGVGTNGQVLTADSTVSPTGLKWATPSSGASFAGVAVTKIANQLINDTTYTVLSFDSEDLDIGGYHDNSSNNSRLTVPSGKAGYYYAYFSIAFAGNSSNGGSGRRAFIMKNGAVASLCNMQSDVSTTVTKSLTSGNIFNLAVGDYLEVAAFQTSSSNINVLGGDYYCVFGMTYLGA